MPSRKAGKKEEERAYDYCQYRNCRKQSDIIVVVDGHYYGLCEKHYQIIDRLLDRVLESGKRSVSLEDLKVYTKKGRITHIAIKERSA